MVERLEHVHRCGGVVTQAGEALPRLPLPLVALQEELRCWLGAEATRCYSSLGGSQQLDLAEQLRRRWRRRDLVAYSADRVAVWWSPPALTRLGGTWMGSTSLLYPMVARCTIPDLVMVHFMNPRSDSNGVEQVSSLVGFKIGSQAGFGLFYFFNPLTEASKPVAFVIHGLTVTFAWKLLLLPASENEKE